MEINEITGIVIREAIQIHKDVGPGLLESVYEELLCYRLTKVGLNFKRQKRVKLVYEDIEMDIDLRYDLLVEEKVIVELKSQEIVPPVAFRILRTYLQLTGVTVGLLINFNVEILKEGIKRVVLNYKD